MTPACHCQICGRAIKANTGLIAHHGYRRPGQGWQTSSCMGARFRPYEVACDALPPAIQSCTRYLDNQQEALVKWLASPPETINWYRSGGYKEKEYTCTRPADFNPTNHRPSYMREEYTFQFDAQVHRYKASIKDTQETLAYLEKRLAEWRAPAENNLAKV